MYENRKFLIFNVSELHLIDFSQVLESSANTVRLSVDKTKTFVKWESESEPTFVSSLTTKEGPFTYQQIMDILSTEEWTPPLPDTYSI